MELIREAHGLHVGDIVYINDLWVTPDDEGHWVFLSTAMGQGSGGPFGLDQAMANKLYSEALRRESAT